MKISAYASTIAACSIALAGMGTASAVTITSTTSPSGETDFTTDHATERYTDTLYKPRDGAVTIQGNVDLSDTDDGSALLLGLVDADYYDSADNPDLATYQSGAYAYFAKNVQNRTTDGNVVGLSDGNAGDGEVVQNATETDNDSVDFTFTVSPDGSIEVSFDGQTISDSYGDVKFRPDVGSDYDGEEFANGAYFATDFSASGVDDSVSYDITATPGTPVGGTDVPEPSPLVLLGLGVFAALGFSFRRRQNA